MTLKSLVLAWMIMVLAAPISANEVVRHSTAGSINWSQGTVMAIGRGVAPAQYAGTPKGELLARRAAVVDAYRNLAELTSGVQLTSELTVKTTGERHTDTKARVEALIRGAEVTGEQFTGGIYQVSMQMPLGARFLQAVFPPERYQHLIGNGSLSARPLWQEAGEGLAWLLWQGAQVLIPSANATPGAPFPAITDPSQLHYSQALGRWQQANPGAELSAPLAASIEDYQRNLNVSGIVIDARNAVGFEMAAMPALVDEAGNRLYPNENTSYEQITQRRPVSYSADLTAARHNPRVTEEPLVIRARGIYKRRFSDLVIASEDLPLLQRLVGDQHSALNNAKVIVVVAE